MKTVVKVSRTVFALVLVSILAACATNGPGYLTKTMNDKAFIKAEPEKQRAYLKAVVDEDAALQRKKDTEYFAGRPVTYGDKKTGYTVQWDKKLQLVHIYPGHHNGLMGIEEESLLTLQSDDKGRIKYHDIANGAGGTYQKPTFFLANVVTQEGLGRVLLKGGIQVGSAYVNGALAADIYKDGSCGKNCGNITLNNGANANAGSESNAGAAVDIRSGGSCGSPLGCE